MIFVLALTHTPTDLYTRITQLFSICRAIPSLHSFDDQPVSVLCDKKHWEKFGNFLLLKYTISGSDDKVLGSTGVISNLRNMMRKANGKFGESDDSARLFFSCIGRNKDTTSAIWLTKFQRELQKAHFKRANAAGETEERPDQTPLFFAETVVINKGYSKAGTPEAATRRLSITVHRSGGGRSAEPADIHEDGLKWNKNDTCLGGEWPQEKTAKTKFIPFIAGPGPECCIFTSWGDVQVLCGGSASFYETNEDGTHYLCSDLQVKHPGKKLGLYYKEAGPGQPYNIRKFDSEWSGEEVSANQSAQDVRRGSVDELLAEMPEHFAAIGTGHEILGKSALFEYNTQTVAAVMPAAVVLGGWPGFEYGRRGKGPKPASLDQLVLVLGASRSEVDSFVDSLLNIHSGAPPALKTGGRLRPFVEHAAASLVMYYFERSESKEMQAVQARQREVFEDVFEIGRGGGGRNSSSSSSSISNAHLELSNISKLTKERFNASNLHLTSRAVASSIGQENHLMAELSQKLTSCRELVLSQQQQQQKQLAFIQSQHERQLLAVQQQILKLELRVFTSARTLTGEFDATATAAVATAGAPGSAATAGAFGAAVGTAGAPGAEL